MSDILFFGCWDRPGHYLFTPAGRHTNGASMPDALQPSRMDGQFAPKRPEPSSGLGFMETKGQAAVHRVEGWTVVAWWDRSVDTRPGSNSALLMRGAHTMTAVLMEAADNFPALLPRFATLMEVAP